MVRKIVPAMGLDLGNGYIKLRTVDKTLIEPSVYSVVPNVDFMQGADCAIGIGNMRLYVGKSALESDLKLVSAVGTTDALTRYMSKEYRYLLYGILAATYETDLVIEHLVLGLPNNHYRECKDEVRDQFNNKEFTLQYQGKQVSIRIEHVVVFPQPLGSYVREGIEKKRVMVVDLGAGTNDYTEFNKLGNIINMFSNTEGLKKYHLEVMQYLQRKHPSIKMNILDIPNILTTGLTDMKGERVNVNDRYVKSLQTKFAGYILHPLIEQYDHLSQFDEILLTGGGALAFKDAIIDHQEEVAQIRVVDDAQMANAEGFYRFAEAFVRAET